MPRRSAFPFCFFRVLLGLGGERSYKRAAVLTPWFGAKTIRGPNGRGPAAGFFSAQSGWAATGAAAGSGRPAEKCCWSALGRSAVPLPPSCCFCRLGPCLGTPAPLVICSKQLLGRCAGFRSRAGAASWQRRSGAGPGPGGMGAVAQKGVSAWPCARHFATTRTKTRAPRAS